MTKSSEMLVYISVTNSNFLYGNMERKAFLEVNS